MFVVTDPQITSSYKISFSLYHRFINYRRKTDSYMENLPRQPSNCFTFYK